MAMQLLELTLDAPEENLALDEALLEEAEQSADFPATLRLWEPRQTMVVVGSSSRIGEEVNFEACRAGGVPVVRRASGGAAIVTGPGCLMYSLVLTHRDRPQMHGVDRAHHFVLESLAASLRRHLPEVRRAGISDLALGDRKFSGNSLRWKQTHFLYHGTLLYRFPLETIASFLENPLRQPAYRERRGHDEFLTNLPLGTERLRQAVIDALGAHEPRRHWPRELAARLVAEKYGRREWNERL